MREKIEALEAIQSALDCKKYTGDYVFSLLKGDDVNVYCTPMRKEDLSGRLIAIAWKETQAGATSAYVDINPSQEDPPGFADTVCKAIESYLEESGFVKELEIANIWSSWKKEIAPMKRKEP
jgi:hypothetical protein